MKPVTEPILLAAANAFDFGGPVVCDGRHYGEGHINDTYLVWRADHYQAVHPAAHQHRHLHGPGGPDGEHLRRHPAPERAKILAEGGDPMA